MAHTAANQLKTNPIVLEVFNADVVVSATPITVKLITFSSAAAADVFALTNNTYGDAAIVRCALTQTVNGGMEVLDFGPGGFTFDDLHFDTDLIQSGLSAGDRVMIYLK